MRRLTDLRSGSTENRLFPLFWQHHEPAGVLVEHVEAMHRSGIGGFVVEARPHPDFVGPGWWEDLDLLLAAAEERAMQVWVFDDAHFPTGSANGRVAADHPELRKRFLKLTQRDFHGPARHARAIVRYALGAGRPDLVSGTTDRAEGDDAVVGVYVARRVSHTEIDPATIVEVTDTLDEHGTVALDLGPGIWRLLIVTATCAGGEKSTEGYLNPLLAEATDVLIDTVYEPHRLRYEQRFGTTFRGFFSDEPRFGNVHGALASIGRADMVLPWRDDLVDLLDARAGSSTRHLLPLLWVDGGDEAHRVRYLYMDLVSELYAENFSGRLGGWCHRHGLEYIGHTIEDNNAHARLGYGAGHFFRAMRGQDMAGIDVVLHQLLPGFDEDRFASFTSLGWDGPFFHHVLAKLGSSLGHLDPTKHGRVMCEVFGAYGWAEGNRLMKWLLDHMLVRGVNVFVPHAVDPGPFPDVDCPPHLYAHGRDPQFPELGALMGYANRMAHLFSDGVHRAPVAVLYHAEAEWSGEYQLVQEPAAALNRAQIDYDIVPIDAVLPADGDADGLRVAGETFRALVVPYAEALPAAFLVHVAELAANGLPVYWLGELPRRASEDAADAGTVPVTAGGTLRIVARTDDLVGTLRRDGIADVRTDRPCPYLRQYRYAHDDGELVMLLNEHPSETLVAQVTLPLTAPATPWDVLNDAACDEVRLVAEHEAGTVFAIELAPGRSVVIPFGAAAQDVLGRAAVRPRPTAVERTVLTGPVTVAVATQVQYPDFGTETTLDALVPLETLPGLDRFSGIARYRVPFEWAGPLAAVRLELTGVPEAARVQLNAVRLGTRIGAPYVFDTTDGLREGSNVLEIEVTSTLAREQQDFFSQYLLLEPTGLTGSISLLAPATSEEGH
ncbi:MAG TPA: hypothetical protein VGC67_17080 [Cellulomonas sp.]